MSNSQVNIDVNLITAQAQANAQAFQRSAVGLSTVITGIYAGIKLANVALQGLSSALAGTVGSAVKFQAGIAEISTLLDGGAEATKQIEQDVINLKKTFGGDTATITTAYYNLISSGAIEAGDAMDVLTIANQLAIGGVTDVNTAINGLTTVISSYGLEATEASYVSDAFFIAMKAGKTTVGELAAGFGQVASAGNALGVNFDELLAATAALTTGGISTSVAYTQLKGVVAELSKPTANLQKALDAAGITSVETALKTDGLGGVLNKLAGTTDGTASTILQLFGSVEAGSAVLALTSDEIGGTFIKVLDTMKKASQDAGKVSQEAFEKIAETADFQTKRMQASFEVFSLKIGQALLPAVGAITAGINKLLDSVLTFIETNQEQINFYAIKLASTITSVIKTIETLINFIAKNSEIVIALASALAGGALAYGVYTIAINASTIATTAMAIATGALTTILAVLTSPITAIVVAVGALTAGLVFWYRNQELVNGYLKQFAAFIISGVQPAINFFIDAVAKVRQVLDFMGGAIQVAIGYLIKLQTIIIGSIIKTFGDLIGAIGKVAGLFNKDLGASITSASNSLKKIGQDVKDTSKKFIENGQAQMKLASDSTRYTQVADIQKKAIDDLKNTLMQQGLEQVDNARATALATKEAKENELAVKAQEKKQKELENALAGVATQTSDVSAKTVDLTSKNKGLTESEKEKTEALKEQAEAVRIISIEERDAFDAREQYQQSLMQSYAEEKKAREEQIKDAEAYTKKLVDMNEEIKRTSELNGLAKNVKIAPEDKELASVVGEDSFKDTVAEAERLKSYGKYEEAELVLQKMRVDAEPKIAKAREEAEKNAVAESIARYNEVFSSIGNTFSSAITGSLGAVSPELEKIFSKSIEPLLNVGSMIASSLNFDAGALAQSLFGNIGSYVAEGIAKGGEVLLSFASAGATIFQEGMKIVSGSLISGLDSALNSVLSIPEKLTTSMDSLSGTLLSGLDFGTAIDSLIVKIPTFIESVVQQLPTIIKSIAEKLPQLIDTLVENLPLLIDAIVDAIPVVLPKLIDGVFQLIEALIKKLPSIIQAIVKLLPNIISGIMKVIPALIRALPEIIKAILKELPNIIKSFVAGLPEIIMAIVEAIPEIIGAIIEALPDIIFAIIEAIPTIIMALIQAIPTLIMKVIELIPTLIMALVDVFVKSITQPFKDLGNIFGSEFGENIKKFGEAVGNFFKNIFNGIGKFFVSIFDFFKGIADGFVNGFRAVIKFFSGIAEWFVNAFNGVVNFFAGIVDFFAQIFNNIANFFGNIGDGIADFFGFAKGGIVGYSNGGLVNGKARTSGDDKRNDTIPVMLSPGELVIPRSYVKQGLAGIIDFASSALNSSAQNMYSGGIVSGSQAQSFDVRELYNELKEMRQEMKAMGYEMVKNTQKTVKIFSSWDGNGMPDARGY